MKSHSIILIILLALMAVITTVPSDLSADLTVEDSIGFPVVFVGNHVIDLQWTQVIDAIGYTIERDGTPIATFGPNTTFYRDTAAPAGTHTYTIYIERESESQFWAESTVTLGDVHGDLYQDLAWSDSVYNIVGFISIESGVSLTTSPGVEINNTSTQAPYFVVKGYLEAEEIDMHVGRLVFDGGTATIRDSSLRGTLGVEIINQADVLLEGNTIGSSEDLLIQSGSTAILNNNEIEIDVRIQDEAEATLYRNWIEYSTHRSVYITDSPQVTLADNYVYYVDASGLGNTAVVNVDNNFIYGGISLGDGDPNANVNITNNNLARYEKTIAVTGNIGVQAALNCFHYNGTALTVNARTAPLNATNNWWGDPSGPEHPSNPSGTGGLIDGDSTAVVTFAPWAESTEGIECGPPDLVMEGFLVQQSVRPLTGEIPLVSNKPAVLKYYASTFGTSFSNVPLRISGSRDGVALGTVNHTISIVDDLGADGYIRLPDEWLTGTLTLDATINPDHDIDEAVYSNNTAVESVDFTIKKPMRIAYVPINYQPSGDDGLSPNIASIPKMHDFLEKTYPVPHVDYVIWSTLTWPLQMNGHADEDPRADLLIDTLMLKLAIFNAAQPADEQIDQIVGVVASGATSFAYSDPPWDDGQGQAIFSRLDGYDLAHEIGHNLNLRHPHTNYSCGAKDLESDWPYYNDPTIHSYGYDVLANMVIPYTRKDFMTYCSPDVWMSAFHYGKLFSEISTPSQRAVITTAQPYLLVSGTVQKDGTVTFAPFWQVTTAVAPVNTPAGSDYCVSLQDNAGNALQTVCFDLSFYNHETYQDLDVDSFFVSLPVDNAAKQVVLRQGTTNLAQLPVSANAPTVTLLTPTGGQSVGDIVSVTWIGSDLDADELAYNISYSADDGLSWIPVALNLTGTAYELDLRQLPGTNTGRLKIEVSDGFHTAVDQMDSSFVVSDRSPLVGINAPLTGDTVTETVTLRGYGFDPEDGELTGTSLEWSSDQAGVLGTDVEVPDVDLTSGIHTVTLTATDSKGHVSSESIVVNGEEAIAGLMAINSSPTTPGLETMFTASVTDGSHVVYSWNFGDGQSGTGAEVSHVYSKEGQYGAVVTAGNSVSVVTAVTTVVVGDLDFPIYLPMLQKP